MDLGAFQEILRKKAVDVGCVLEMDLFPEDGITTKPGKKSKLKRFVIVGKTKDGSLLASLIVNSEINNGLFCIIGPYQHLLRAKENSCVDHDSYVDGYTLFEFNADRVISSGKFLGRISAEDLEECRKHVCDSPKTKPYQKKKFNLE